MITVALSKGRLFKDFIKFLHLQQSKYNKINDVAKSSEVKKNLEEIDELLSRSKNV